MSEKPADKRRGRIPSLADAESEGTETKVRTPSKAPTLAGRDRPFLLVLAGATLGEMYPLREQENIVGRSITGTTIQIEDEDISRRHAKLTCDGNEVHIEDLGGVNGTLVNGVRLTSKRLLKDGDQIALGSTVLKFTYSDALEETFQKRMLQAALRDGLTGAFNKKYFMDRLGTELAFAQRHRTPLSIIMIDIDHFKWINDSFGHPVGDTVLVKLATVVSETIRQEDVFARYGGEEFVVLCRGVDVEHARILAERLRERIVSMPLEHEGEGIAVTVSMGVAGYPGVTMGTSHVFDPAAPEKLVAAADEALYEAKANGRNRVVTKRKEPSA